MSETKDKGTEHTPGPWFWATSNSWRRLMRAGGRDGGVLCPTNSRSDGHPDLIVSESDMRLIAAAPLLLDALRAVEWNGTDTCEGIEWCCCPECGGLVEEPTSMHPANRDRRHVGHASDCGLAAALAAATGEKTEGK